MIRVEPTASERYGAQGFAWHASLGGQSCDGWTRGSANDAERAARKTEQRMRKLAGRAERYDQLQCRIVGKEPPAQRWTDNLLAPSAPVNG